MHKDRQEATVLGWMKALPRDLFKNRPVLSILDVAALMSNGEIEGVEERAERRAMAGYDRGQACEKEIIVVNEERNFSACRVRSLYRAGMALAG
jgi:LuxR family maltose regulon positive regulatory protein